MARYSCRGLRNTPRFVIKESTREIPPCLDIRRIGTSLERDGHFLRGLHQTL
jgi:hypothetical protein